MTDTDMRQDELQDEISPLLADVRRAVAAWQAETGHSQATLAQRIGCTPGTLSLRLHGRRGLTLTTVEQIAQAIGRQARLVFEP